MRSPVKYLLILFLSLFQSAWALELNPLSDSVFRAVKYMDLRLLQSLVPAYSDLRAVYDSSDMEMMNYQISLRQKELEWFTRKDLKRIEKWSEKERVKMEKLEFQEAESPLYEDKRGYRFSNVILRCTYKDRFFHVHYTAIELNGRWFYGEGLRVEEFVPEKEEIVDYDKIERQREKRRAAREKRIEEQKQQEEKEALKKKQEEEKAIKAEEKRKEQELRDKQRLAREDSLRIKEEQRELRKKQKEEELKTKEQERELKKKQKEAELAEKEKQRELEKKQKEQKLKEKQKQKERDRKEKEDNKGKEEPGNTGKQRRFQNGADQ